jgi:hypothetical protein
MNSWRQIGTAIALAIAAATPAAHAAASETFTATASVKGTGGAAATAPVTVTVDRTTPQQEADTLVAAFKSGGAAALRKALAGLAPTGSVKLAGGAPVATRLTIERTTDKGRLVTILVDKPVLFVGGSLPGAKAKEGYDFALLDLEIDAKGNGTGTLAPAARLKATENAFVVEDYGSEPVRLTAVKSTKK